jgi:hypothetical protein
MPLTADLTVTLSTQRISVGAALGTFYQVRDLYSLLQDLFDESGATTLAGSMAYPTPMSAQTPTDYTLKSGWYMTDQSYRRLLGGSIQTSGQNTVIYKLTFNTPYTNAIAGDIGKVVTNGAGATGTLLDYDNTAKWWRVRLIGGTFANTNALTITSGTGAGTLAAASASQTGEEGWANAYTVGTVVHGGTYIVQGTTQLPVSDWYQTGNTGAGNVDVDVLVKIKEVGTTISSGIVTFYNRNNFTAAGASGTGDTYDWYQADLSGFGRNPVPLSCRADLNDTMSDATASGYSGITINTGTYNVDVDSDGSTETYSGQIDANSQTLAVVYQVLKYRTRSGATTGTINSITPNQFTRLSGSYTAVKDCPIASFAGGKLFLARGWVIINVAAADASNYQTVDNSGNTKTPPQYYVRAITGLTSGQRVFMALRSATDTANTSEFTLAAGNNSGNGTIVLSSSPPADKPATGRIRVFDNSGNEDSYAYTGISGSTVTLSGTLSKTYATSNKAYIPYIDTTAAGASVSISLRYVADRNVVSNVRLGSSGSKMIPFSSNYTLTNADSSVPATVLADTINTTP